MIDDILIFLAIVLAWTFVAWALEPYGWCKNCWHTHRPGFLSRWLTWPKYVRPMLLAEKGRCAKCGNQSFEWH